MLTPNNIIKRLSPNAKKRTLEIEERYAKLEKEIRLIDYKLNKLRRKQENE